MTSSRLNITAIVPTFNEAKRIADPLRILTTHPDLQEIIVVDDGSVDNTREIVRTFTGIRYFKLSKNYGKGTAMDYAVAQAKNDIIFFCDADIQGLTHDIVSAIIHPVASGQADMFIGMRNRKIYYLRFLLRLIPLLGGERAMTRSLWYKIPSFYKQGFRIEAALNYYAQYRGSGYQYAVFSGLTQTIKEQKYGLLDGLKRRWRMTVEIMTTEIKLRQEASKPIEKLAR